jgi:hypothetical protein
VARERSILLKDCLFVPRPLWAQGGCGGIQSSAVVGFNCNNLAFYST